ncbi:Histidinol-phosphate aminotransferase [Streptomyces californicus]
MEFRQFSKLNEVCYEIRGPVIEHANALEEAGHSVLRLNTGNPALFGSEAPEEIVQDMIRMLPQAHGYTDSRGILSAGRAVVQRYQAMGLTGIGVDDVFLGNGVSELISMAVQALLEDGDEVLIPAPDFPLWTAVTTLAGGKAVHYACDEESDWNPDLADMAAKITDRTRAVVIINPNNPTGAVIDAHGGRGGRPLPQSCRGRMPDTAAVLPLAEVQRLAGRGVSLGLAEASETGAGPEA